MASGEVSKWSCHVTIWRLPGLAAWFGGLAAFAVDILFEKNSQYYTEIEVVSLGKSKSKDKLVIGLVSRRTNANSVKWQNSNDLEDRPFLLAVSICDKVKVWLLFHLNEPLHY